jgi:hypothetical protein
MPRGPAKGTSNNPSGNSKTGRNNMMTARQRKALDHENSGSKAKRAAAVALRARNAGW